MTADGKLRLGIYLNNTGAHEVSWRHPSVDPRAVTTLKYWARNARLAEACKADFLFFADNNQVRYRHHAPSLRQLGLSITTEPFTTIAALAGATEHIGLVSTASTTYNEPYHVARKFAWLDHLSGGRASWNAVTTASPGEAPNFSAEKHPGHGDRYLRAQEFLRIVRGLWDSWEDDAFPRDQQSGTMTEPAKMHFLNYRSEEFAVEGPLNLPRSPQGWPVIFQAGSSDVGREFGAETADAIFTAQQTHAGAQAFYRDVKQRMGKYGRDPGHLLIFPGVCAIVGRTRVEAQEKYDFLQSMLSIESSLFFLSDLLGGTDLSKIPLDEPLTDLPPTEGMKGRRELLLAKAREKNFTLRQLAYDTAGLRGHRVLIGTAEEIADDFQHWFETEAADGFLLAPALLPQSLEDYAELLIPELQRRGLFRTDYEGSTMRENLGIPRPVHPASGRS